MLAKTITAMSALVLLGGCALSPQQVSLAPDPTVPAANVGHNAPVEVTVVDEREDEAFGTRGGPYQDTALIRPANDLEAVVGDIVRNGLQKQGFNAYNPADGATQLTVHIRTLSYVPESGSVVNRVTTRSELRAVAKRPEATHRATFRSKVEHDTPFTPDARRNEEMMTDVLQRSLERLLADSELLAFLAGSDDPGAATDTDEQQGQTDSANEETQ